jgi:(p)ppGpp synthase/HD superfamily hydrolase
MGVIAGAFIVAFLASVRGLVPGATVSKTKIPKAATIAPNEEFLSEMDKDRWRRMVCESSNRKPDDDGSDQPALMFAEDKIPLMEIPDARAWQLVRKDEPVGNEGPITLKDYFWNLEKLEDSQQMRITENVNEIYDRVALPNLSRKEMKQLRTALELAQIALWGMRTERSKELSIDRAIGVASVLGEMHQSLDIILAGILHEVLSKVVDKDAYHRPLYYQEFERVFGKKAIALASEYAKLPKYISTKATYTDQQSENQMQNLVASSANNVPLLIRLADRVHVMRNLQNFPVDEIDRQKIAQETLCVYAPLASKLGLSQVKGELEDFSFSHLNPDDFQKCSRTHFAASKVLECALNDIPDALRSNNILLSSGVKWYIQSRVKGKYQLFKKMERKGLQSPHEVKDALGLRLVLDVPREHWQTKDNYRAKCKAMCHLSSLVIENMPDWEKVRHKDYISRPKENGYRSLHGNYVNLKFNSTVEVQIRTVDMHRDAEVGEAAHWFYKDMLYRPVIANGKAYRQTWRTAAQLQAESSDEVVNLARQTLQRERVFVFMEDKGTVINLRRGSKTLDAAFAVHSSLGLYTKCVKVNDVIVGLHRPLQMHDVVRVVTSITAQAQRFWYDSVSSRGARGALDNYFKTLNQHQICKALVKLLFVMYASADGIDERYGVSGKVVSGRPVRTPNGRWLSTKAVHRVGAKDIVDFLATLYKKDTTPSSAQRMLAKLFDISPSNLTVTTENMSLIQVRKAVEAEDPKMLELIDRVVRPLVREVLPEMGIENIEESWEALLYYKPKSQLTKASIGEYDYSLHLPAPRSAMHTYSQVSPRARMTAQEAALAKQALRNRLSNLERLPSRRGPGHLPAGIKSPAEQISPIHLRSPYVVASRPYSKEAPSLPHALLKTARQQYAEISLKREAGA